MESHQTLDSGSENSLKFQRKRLKDKLGAETPTQLAYDLINEVINRLPAVSNFRFKCVSKQWFVLNSGALKRKSERPSMLGIFCATICFPSKTSFEYIKMQKGQNEDSSSIDGTLSFLPKITDLTVYDSCGGLLLCGSRDSCLYICNPATRKWVKIPYNSHKLFSKAFLDFKPLVPDHFNITMIKLCNLQPSFDVFDSETGKWKVLSQMKISWRSSLVFKGLFFGINSDLTGIRGFDMEGNLCRRFDLPDLPGSSDIFKIDGLGQSGGYLHYYISVSSEVHVWKLVDYESGSWLLKNSFPIKGVENYFIYIKFHPDEEDVVFVRVGKRWHLYNIQTTHMVEICSRDDVIKVFPYSPCYFDGLGNKVEGKWTREQSAVFLWRYLSDNHNQMNVGTQLSLHDYFIRSICCVKTIHC